MASRFSQFDQFDQWFPFPGIFWRNALGSGEITDSTDSSEAYARVREESQERGTTDQTDQTDRAGNERKTDMVKIRVSGRAARTDDGFSPEYRAYLASPRWQAKRQAALDRAGHRCELCDDHRSLHVHHLTYERLGFEPLNHLLVVCMECHRIADEARNGAPEYEEWYAAEFPLREFDASDRTILRAYIEDLLDWGEHPHSSKPDAWWAERDAWEGDS